MNKQKLSSFLKNRLRNKYLWMAIIALLTNLAISGVIVLPDNFETIATSVLNILVLLGIFNNPSTQSQSFFIDEDGDGVDDRLQQNNYEEAKGLKIYKIRRCHIQ